MTVERRSLPARSETLDLASLLTIDVASELRKVPGASLEGSWQLPAELVRGALRGGASRVSVKLGRRRLALDADGDGIERGVLSDLARLLNPGLGPEIRHAALLSLESCQALELAALQVLRPERLTVESSAAGHRLSFRAGREVRLERLTPRPARGLRLVIQGLRIDRRQARRWLETVCRFSPALIEVDGQELSRGFGESLGTIRLEGPLDGWLSLPREGETARVWLLQHGVVAAHVTLGGLFCFEAAVEMRALAPSPRTAAALREAITPYVRALADQALDRLLDLAPSVPDLPQTDATRVRSLLLACARKRRRTTRLLSAAVFPAVAPLGNRRWLSLLDVGELRAGRGESSTLRTLHPSQDPAGFVLPGEPVLLLTASERAALKELLGTRFRPPDRRETSSSPWTRGRLALARAVGRVLQRLLFPSLGSVVPEAALSRQEQELLALLRAQAPAGAGHEPLDVRFCSGRGRVVRVGRGRPRFLLPRANATVVAAVRSAAQDPAWAYPAALALLEDATPRSGAGVAWRRRPPGSIGSDPTHS